MALVDLATVQTIATGQPFLAATLQQIRDNFEFLADPPACSVYNSAAATLSSSVSLQTLSANSENFDNDSMHSTSSNTSRITIQTDGRYLVFGSVNFAANTSGRRALAFVVNGSTTYNVGGAHPVQTANSMAMSGVRAVVLTAGDYVELQVVQSSGGDLDVTLSEFAVFWMTR